MSEGKQDSEPKVLTDEEKKKQEEFEKYHGIKNFVALHEAQFRKMGLPPHLWKTVHTKLYGDIYDVTDSFTPQYVEDEGFRLICSAKGGLKKEQGVWLIDHAWTTNKELARQQLSEVDGLMDRLWTMMDMDRRLGEKKAAEGKSDKADEYEADEASVLAVCSQANVTEAQARQALLMHAGDIIAAIHHCESLSDKPETAEQAAVRQMEENLNENFRQSLAMQQPDMCQEAIEKKISQLIDVMFDCGFAGTYFVTQPKSEHQEFNPADVMNIIYVNDEVGSSIRFSAEPNARLEPLICITLGGIAYSLLWLVKDVDEEDIITRAPPVILRPTELK